MAGAAGQGKAGIATGVRAMGEGDSPIGPALTARREVMARGGGVTLTPKDNGSTTEKGRYRAEGASARGLGEGGGDSVMGRGAPAEYACVGKGSVRVSDGGPEQYE